MARPKRNSVDFFPHDCISSSKLLTIINKFGVEGYTTFYRLRERLGHENFHCIEFNEEEIINLAVYCFVSEEKLIEILNFFSKIGIINKDLFQKHKIIFSEDFIEYVKDAYVRRNNNCIDLEGLCQHLSIKYDQISSSHVIPFNKKSHSRVEKSRVEKSSQKIDFFVFWDLYDKKTGNPDEIEKCWNKIPGATQKRIIDYLPEYVKSTPNKQFRKNPLKFLEAKAWLNEIIPHDTNKDDEKEEERIPGVVRVSSSDLNQLKELLSKQPNEEKHE